MKRKTFFFECLVPENEVNVGYRDANFTDEVQFTCCVEL